VPEKSEKGIMMKKVLRILGLILISIIAALYLLIIVGGLFEQESISLEFESLGMLVLTLLTVISVVFAWVKTRIGVWIVLAVGILFTLFGLLTAGSNRILAVIAAGGPLVIGSLLIILGLERSKPAAEG
jgi:hypothetical protein